VCWFIGLALEVAHPLEETSLLGLCYLCFPLKQPHRVAHPLEALYCWVCWLDVLVQSFHLKQSLFPAQSSNGLVLVSLSIIVSFIHLVFSCIS
jgi:hypothetical protein